MTNEEKRQQDNKQGRPQGRPFEPEEEAVENSFQEQESWKETSHIFNPEEELQTILKAPSKERLAMLADFKERLADQRESFAQLQEALVDTVR